MEREPENALRWGRRARDAGPEILAAALAIAAGFVCAGGSLGHGFPVDDAWIHLVYGLALRRGEGFAYNTGTAATGCTSPLWVVFSALAHLLSGERGPSFAAATCLKGIGIMWFGAAAALGARLARLCAPRRKSAPIAALAAGALIACTPILAYASVSGMEVSLTSALMLGALVLAGRRRMKLAAFVAGVAALARPEAVLTLPFIVALAAVPADPSLRVPLVARVRRLVTTSAIGLAPVLALLLRNVGVSGRPLPATFYRKARLRVDILFEDLDAGFRTILGHLTPTSFLVLWVCVTAAILFGLHAVSQRASHPRGRVPPRRMLAASAAMLGTSYVAGISVLTRLHGGGLFYFERYVLPPVPLLIVAAVSAAMWAGETRFIQIRSSAIRQLARRGVRAVVLAAFTVSAGVEMSELPAMRVRYARDVDDIDGVQVALGQFVRATLSPAAVVWSQDAGAIRYFGERRVVDLNELNTPELFGGKEIPEAWWPDSVIVSLGAFRVEAAPGVVDTVKSIGAGSDPTSVLGRQYVYRCRGSGGLVVVYRHEKQVAVGRCARR